MHSLALMTKPLLTECTNDKGRNGMWALRGPGDATAEAQNRKLEQG